MTDFKAKMHQIRFRLGLCPRPRWGSLQRSPRPLAAFKGPTSNGRGGMKGEGGEGERRGGAPHKCWNLGPQLPCYATVHQPPGTLYRHRCNNSLTLTHLKQLWFMTRFDTHTRRRRFKRQLKTVLFERAFS